jgi:hypothetical protein
LLSYLVDGFLQGQAPLILRDKPGLAWRTEASFDGADGAVCSTSDNRSLEQTILDAARYRACASRPSAPLRKGPSS